MDYVSLENAANQRRQHAACMVFAGYTRKILYIFTEFQVPEGLHRGPKFSHIYLIEYHIDYTIGFIIIYLIRSEPEQAPNT